MDSKGRFLIETTSIQSLIAKILHVIQIDLTILLDSSISPIIDNEDAVIEVSAMKHNTDYILSRYISDFKSARIPTYTPKQFYILYFLRPPKAWV